VVHDAELRRGAIASVAAAGVEHGAAVCGFAPSGLPGPAGNRETFVWFAESGRPGGDIALEDVDV
jgi:23S rRNA (cytidine1920-2'-O)/16S rRNA (cytidine1409-2'-O)-methyltransferase